MTPLRMAIIVQKYLQSYPQIFQNLKGNKGKTLETML